jgi:hypothetical protein
VGSHEWTELPGILPAVKGTKMPPLDAFVVVCNVPHRRDDTDFGTNVLTALLGEQKVVVNHIPQLLLLIILLVLVGS